MTTATGYSRARPFGELTPHSDAARKRHLQRLIQVSRRSIQLGAPRTTGWTFPSGDGYGTAMTPKRSTFDPLQPTLIPTPTWLVVRTMTGMTIDTREIPAGTDLRRLFVATMLEWMDAGWTLGEFSSVAPTFFCARDNERRMVTIQPMSPDSLLTSGTAGLQGCPNCGD